MPLKRRLIVNGDDFGQSAGVTFGVALAHERGHLVGHALAPTGGHEYDGVATGDHLRDDIGLVAPELLVPEYLVQHGARVGAGEDAGRNTRGGCLGPGHPGRICVVGGWAHAPRGSAQRASDAWRGRGDGGS